MTEVVQTKRGRKKASENAESVTQVPKKRGRKPRGGKLVVRNDDLNNTPQMVTSIILNLKCSLKDLDSNQQISDTLKYDPSVPPTVESYQNNAFDYSIYNNINENESKQANNSEQIFDNEINNNAQCINIKDVNKKLKDLKIQYHKKNVNKKSGCFWCTYEFDNPTCYIPNQISDDNIIGYGSFCRPECAVSYLFREDIDDALKFERYHLLNSIYCSVYNYTKNIKPAPDPHYLLDKFYGNLTIHEYRKLLSTEHMLLILDKPMTRNLPELHDDTDNFINDLYGSNNDNNQSTTTGKYKVKRESEKKKGPSKNSLIAEHFGL
jgi:hypothetical protein